MKNEYSNEETGPKQEGIEEQRDAADDIKFMRSVVEKTSRQFGVDGHILIMWGLLCMIGYTAAYFFITPEGDMTAEVRKWILPVYLFMMTIGICYTIIAISIAIRREKKNGFVPYLPKQITLVWFFMAAHILAWSILGMLTNNFCGGDPGFMRGDRYEHLL